MQPCGCTPWDENVCGAEAGNHKGCPYNGFVGVYFQSNDRGPGLAGVASSTSESSLYDVW